MVNLSIRPLQSFESDSTFTTPFITTINGDKVVLFSKKAKSDGVWKLHFGVLDENGDVTEISQLQTGLSESHNELSPAIYKRSSDDNYVLTFCAWSNPRKSEQDRVTKAYQMVGVDITTLGAASIISTFDLISQNATETSKYKICVGVYEEQENSNDSIVKIHRFSDSKRFVLVHPFDKVLRVTCSVLTPDVIFLTAKKGSDVFTFAYDLAGQASLGYVLSAGVNVCNAMHVDAEHIIFTTKNSPGCEDTVICCSENFAFYPVPDVHLELVDVTAQ